MNMFRNILTVACFTFGICLYIFPTDEWKWVDLLGGQAVMVLNLMGTAQPFTTLIFLVIGTALFMTRKQY
jgi:hypothetical protein